MRKLKAKKNRFFMARVPEENTSSEDDTTYNTNVSVSDCASCNYYSHNSELECAVHPEYTGEDNCEDYESKSD